MRFHFDEDLVEAVVFRCAAARVRAPALQIARFHRAREKLYAILDPEERNAAFFTLHLEWFREWGFEALLTDPVREFPEITRSLGVLAFRQCRGEKEEGAELYVNDSGDRTGVVALRPERLLSSKRSSAAFDSALVRPSSGIDTALMQNGPNQCRTNAGPIPNECRTNNGVIGSEIQIIPFLHHELMHLRDMVDPAFGYRPQLALAAWNQSQHSLARERYRLLWDISIDGRLARAGKPTIASREQRWAELDQACAFLIESKRREIFDTLWSNPNPTHAALEAWVCDPRQLQSGEEACPGAVCPLCGFPTFAWADTGIVERHASMIRAEFPHWTPARKVCARCAAVYHARDSLRV